jgi:flagellar basal-body rod protein FlgB
MLENINLFSGLNEKMAYLSQRQRVIAQNITNADTPNFRPSDIKAPDFAKTLGVSESRNAAAKLTMTTTQGGHMNHIMKLGERSPSVEVQRHTYEISPTGNAVDLEEQMLKSSQTNMDYQLATNLYSKNIDLLRMSMRSGN